MAIGFIMLSMAGARQGRMGKLECLEVDNILAGYSGDVKGS